MRLVAIFSAAVAVGAFVAVFILPEGALAELARLASIAGLVSAVGASLDPRAWGA